MKIIVGLGNPGKEYEKTRHNVGWMFLDYLSSKYGLKIDKKKHDSYITELNIGKEKIILAKPTTYMNLSGNAVLKLKRWYKVDDSDIIVIFDDIDIEFGSIRYKKSGSGGSHNGMKNIVQLLNTENIPRIRIGIGGIKNENQDLKDFVLEKFSKEQLNKLEEIFKLADSKLNECFLLDKN